MPKVCVASISTLLEPSTTASATAACARFLDSTALGTPAAAYRGHTCCRGGFCGNANINTRQEMLTPPPALGLRSGSLKQTDKRHRRQYCYQLNNTNRTNPFAFKQPDKRTSRSRRCGHHTRNNSCRRGRQSARWTWTHHVHGFTCYCG